MLYIHLNIYMHITLYATQGGDEAQCIRLSRAERLPSGCVALQLLHELVPFHCITQACIASHAASLGHV